MKSYPFTSEVTYDDKGLPLYDRAVNSAFLRKVFAQYFSDGIFYKPTSAMQVVAGSGMQVIVEPGCCHIQGAIGIEDSRRTLTVQASESLDRIDTVVARLDLSLAKRDIDLYVVKGTAASSPKPPALTRDATVWELGLSDVFVAKNSASITQQRITDTRLNTERCGLVAQTIGALDTDPYYAQLTAMLEDLRDVIAGIEAGSEVMLKVTYAGSADGVVKAADAVQGAGPYTSANSYGGFSSLLDAIKANSQTSRITYFTAQTRSEWADTPTTSDFEYVYTVFQLSGTVNATVLASSPRNTSGGSNVLYIRGIRDGQWSGNWQTVGVESLKNDIINGTIRAQRAYLSEFVGDPDSTSDGRLYIREKTGTNESPGSIFLQEDTDNWVVNVGIGGKGTVGVNVANKLKTARKIGNASFDGSTDITLAQMGAATTAQGTKADNAMPKSGGTFTGGVTVPILNIGDKSHSIVDDGNGIRYYMLDGDGAHIFNKQGGAFAPVEAGSFKQYDSKMYIKDSMLYNVNDQHLVIRAGVEDTFQFNLGVVDGGWTFCSKGNATHNLGTSSRRFNQIYLANQPDVSSDARQKNSIADVDEQTALRFLASLRPSTFKLNDGESGRTHWGFISQQVEQAMTAAGLTDMDFAGFIRSPKYEEVVKEDGTIESREVSGEYVYSLRYGEFIPVLTSCIQQLQKQVTELQKEISALKTKEV